MEDNRTQFHKILQSHSILLIDKSTKGIATGVFCKYKDNFLILTSAHIFDDSSPDEILINLGIHNQRYPMKKEHIWKDESLDVAYILLNNFEANLFQNNTVPFIINNSISNNELQCNYRYAILGYPAEKAKYIENEKVFAGESYLLTTTVLPIEKWPEDISLDTQQRILLKFGSRQFSNSGQIGIPIDPKGLSGAGIWVYDSNTENDEKPNYALFGIQNGFLRQNKLLVGSKIEPVINKIHEDFASIQPTL